MNKKLLLGVVVTTFLVIACSTTKLRDVWQAESFHHEDFSQVMVVAVTENITNRLIFETEFAAELERKGIEAIRSNVVMGNSKPTKEKVLAYIEKHKVKYVLATRIVDIEIDKNYVQPTATIYATGGYYNGWGGWGGSSTMLTTEGYMDTTKTTILETVIFKSSTKELVWAAKTATFEASAVSFVADEIAKLTVQNIKK